MTNKQLLDKIRDDIFNMHKARSDKKDYSQQPLHYEVQEYLENLNKELK